MLRNFFRTCNYLRGNERLHLQPKTDNVGEKSINEVQITLTSGHDW